MQLENRGAVTRHCCGARRPIDHQSLPSFMRRSLPHDFGTPTPSAQHTPVRPVRRRSPSLFHPAASIFSLSFFPSSLFPTTGARASPRGSCAAGQSRRSRGGSDETEHSVPFRLSVPPWVELASGGEGPACLAFLFALVARTLFAFAPASPILYSGGNRTSATHIVRRRNSSARPSPVQPVTWCVYLARAPPPRTPLLAGWRFPPRRREDRGNGRRLTEVVPFVVGPRHTTPLSVLPAQHRAACATHADARRRDATLARNAVAAVVVVVVVILLPLFSLPSLCLPASQPLEFLTP